MANVPVPPAVAQALAPFTAMVSCTPSDSATFAQTRGLLITGAGTVAVTIGGASATIPAVTATAGSILNFSVTAVKSTGTTATGIFLLY